MGQFATGVTVVTTRDASGQPLGLTVSAFCSVSLEPPLVLVCIDHRSEANRGLRESGRFGVSVLGEHQEDVSRRFAAPGANKLEGLSSWAVRTACRSSGRGGAPRMQRPLVSRRGRRRGLGGRGARGERRPGRPFVHHGGG